MNRRILLTISLAAILGILFLGGEGQSQSKAAKAKNVAKQEVKLREVEVLRNAYILMAMANHDYDGHRNTAMKHVESAIKLLDESIMKHGTNGQKVVAHEEEIAQARAKFAGAHTGTARESQAMSDLQLKEAYQLINEVHSAAAIEKQPKVKEEVTKALHALKTALKIR